MNVKSEKKSCDHDHLDCDAFPGCIWSNGRCRETVCSDHTYEVTCTPHSACTWWEGKCYTMPTCKRTTFPPRLPEIAGCQHAVYPGLPTADDFALPYGPDHNQKCYQTLQSISKPATIKTPLKDSYSPLACFNAMKQETNYNKLKSACQDDAKYLDKFINVYCGYWPEADVKKKVNRVCDKIYNTSPIGHNNLCTVGEDETKRTNNPKYWIPILRGDWEHPQWYVYKCKDYINCTM